MAPKRSAPEEGGSASKKPKGSPPNAKLDRLMQHSHIRAGFYAADAAYGGTKLGNSMEGYERVHKIGAGAKLSTLGGLLDNFGDRVTFDHNAEKGHMVMAFKGSSSMLDFLVDADMKMVECGATRGGKVAEGFCGKWESERDAVLAGLREQLVDNNVTHLTTAGHSLGAAMVNVSFHDIKQLCDELGITFNAVGIATPASGNKAFADTLEGENLLNIINNDDIVGQNLAASKLLGSSEEDSLQHSGVIASSNSWDNSWWPTPSTHSTDVYRVNLENGLNAALDDTINYAELIKNGEVSDIERHDWNFLQGHPKLKQYNEAISQFFNADTMKTFQSSIAAAKYIESALAGEDTLGRAMVRSLLQPGENANANLMRRFIADSSTWWARNNPETYLGSFARPGLHRALSAAGWPAEKARAVVETTSRFFNTILELRSQTSAAMNIPEEIEMIARSLVENDVEGTVSGLEELVADVEEVQELANGNRAMFSDFLDGIRASSRNMVTRLRSMGGLSEAESASLDSLVDDLGLEMTDIDPMRPLDRVDSDIIRPVGETAADNLAEDAAANAGRISDLDFTPSGETPGESMLNIQGDGATTGADLTNIGELEGRPTGVTPGESILNIQGDGVAAGSRTAGTITDLEMEGLGAGARAGIGGDLTMMGAVGKVAERAPEISLAALAGVAIYDETIGDHSISEAAYDNFMADLPLSIAEMTIGQLDNTVDPHDSVVDQAISGVMEPATPGAFQLFDAISRPLGGKTVTGYSADAIRAAGNALGIDWGGEDKKWDPPETANAQILDEDVFGTTGRFTQEQIERNRSLSRAAIQLQETYMNSILMASMWNTMQETMPEYASQWESYEAFSNDPDNPFRFDMEFQTHEDSAGNIHISYVENSEPPEPLFTEGGTPMLMYHDGRTDQWVDLNDAYKIEGGDYEHAEDRFPMTEDERNEAKAAYHQEELQDYAENGFHEDMLDFLREYYGIREDGSLENFQENPFEKSLYIDDGDVLMNQFLTWKRTTDPNWAWEAELYLTTVNAEDYFNRVIQFGYEWDYENGHAGVPFTEEQVSQEARPSEVGDAPKEYVNTGDPESEYQTWLRKPGHMGTPEDWLNQTNYSDATKDWLRGQGWFSGHADTVDASQLVDPATHKMNNMEKNYHAWLLQGNQGTPEDWLATTKATPYMKRSIRAQDWFTANYTYTDVQNNNMYNQSNGNGNVTDGSGLPANGGGNEPGAAAGGSGYNPITSASQLSPYDLERLTTEYEKFSAAWDLARISGQNRFGWEPAGFSKEGGVKEASGTGHGGSESMPSAHEQYGQFKMKQAEEFIRLAASQRLANPF